MEISGFVQNGVVVLDNGASLPEGASVTVVYCQPPLASHPTEASRVSFPLVRSPQPGSVNLTSDRIAEILDDEEIAPGR